MVLGREKYAQPQLNLQTFLVRHPLSTFFARFEGAAMIEANIHDQDLLVIERIQNYSDGHIVLAFHSGERLLRTLHKDHNRILLCPANINYREIEINEETQIFGRLIHSVTHHLRIAQYLPTAK